MTFTQQLEQKGLQQGIEQGEYQKAIAIAKNLLNDGTSPQSVQRLTGLSEQVSRYTHEKFRPSWRAFIKLCHG